MNYKSIILEQILQYSKLLLEELDRRGKGLSMEDYHSYDKIFSGDNINLMLDWIESLETYLGIEEG